MVLKYLPRVFRECELLVFRECEFTCFDQATIPRVWIGKSYSANVEFNVSAHGEHICERKATTEISDRGGKAWLVQRGWGKLVSSLYILHRRKHHTQTRQHLHGPDCPFPSGTTDSYNTPGRPMLDGLASLRPPTLPLHIYKTEWAHLFVHALPRD